MRKKENVKNETGKHKAFIHNKEAKCVIIIIYSAYKNIERMVAMKKILVPVDGSESAKKACQVAKDLALKYDSNVILVTVVSDNTFATHGFGLYNADYMEEVLSRKAEYAKKMLLEIKEDFNDMGEKVEALCERVETQYFVGDIASEIIACANREQADLIVMGSRGLGTFLGSESPLLGSISNKVVHSSKVSVLIVK